MLPFWTASDGGGSTRIPACFSGLFGLKPSHGRIPSPTADTSQTAVLGSLTTTVADTAALLDIVAGPDDRDRTSLPPFGWSFAAATESLDTSGLRIGWSTDLGFAVVDPEVAELTRAAAEVTAKAAGAELVDIDVQLTDPIKTWLTAGGLSLWLAIEEREHWPSRADDLTPFVRMSLEATYDKPGRTMTSALRRRLQLEEDCAAIFRQVDVLCTPTSAITAFAAEGPSPSTINGEDLIERFGLMAAGAMSVPFTMLANLCWNPACSVPAGIASDGLPVGMQIIGRRHADDVVLRLARLFEDAQPWERHAPVAS
jgi:Asp-tRNA(Asn)/Glu-tRNA(Gln) amidotransferase A subunit family amidase